MSLPNSIVVTPSSGQVLRVVRNENVITSQLPVSLRNTSAAHNTIDSLTDVDITQRANNATLVYNAATETYEVRVVTDAITQLNKLTDVDVATRIDNDIIAYNSSTSTWENHHFEGAENQIDISYVGSTIKVGFTQDVQINGAANVAGTLKVHDVAEVYGSLLIEPNGELAPHAVLNPTLTATSNVDSYTQLSIQNQNHGANSSADIIAYPSNALADDATGFIDMGITSNGYNQAEYAVTGPNDGYIFTSAREGDSLGGSLVIATDSSGTNNDIKFFVGGFDWNANSPHVVIAGNTHSFGINNTAPVSKLSVGGDSWLEGNVQTQHVLPLANTFYNIGSASAYWNKVFASNGVFTDVTLTNALSPSNGGTGRNALTLNAVLVGNGSDAVSLVSSSVQGHVLQISSAGVPFFGALDDGEF